MGNKHSGEGDQHGEGEEWISMQFKKGKPQQKNVEFLYELNEELGSGAYSIVYRGTPKKPNPKDPTTVAVKRVSKKNLSEEEDVETLLEEVGILQQVHHPHIMRLYGFYEDPDYYNIVSEIVVGGELFDRIVQRKHYDERHARDLVRIFLEVGYFAEF